MVALSVLDLAPIVAGGTPGQALENSRDLARHAERLGYKRYWLAEHHNMPGIASAATAVAIAHVAGGTSTIRVGAGGIMLPNHAPLVIAEQFGTLASLYPGRIDLALGRAPGTDQLTARALRRSLNATNMDDYPRDVMELMYYFRDPEPGQKVRAIPGAGTKVPVWILGSSTYGAQLAAALGLPYGFASHFAPAELDQAIAIYRANYRPSEENPEPYLMVGTSVFAAPTDEEARYLFSSQQQAFVNLRTGNPGPLPPPVEGFEENLDPRARFILGQALSCAIVGSHDTVKQGLKDFAARTGADEVIATANMFDHAARVRSYEIAAAARDGLEKAA
jgi:luciferase family oxidoreductase group 1